MTENEAAAQEVVFMDRTVRLVWFGILQIIFGGFFALIVSLTLLGTMVSAVAGNGAGEGVGFKKMILVILLYALLAVWFIWVGIGSVKARRWARALILISSWFWLIGGVMGFAAILSLLPNMSEHMGKNGKMPENTIDIIMITFMSLFYVVIPGLLVLFYSGKDVKATCEYRDPHVRWTDRCPLPVLAASIMCAVLSVSMLLSAVAMHGWVLFLGTILSGVPGAIVISVISLSLAYAAIGMYKLDKKAWCVALTMVACLFLSYLTNILSGNMQTLYEKMNLSSRELEMVKQFLSPNISYLYIFWASIQLGYLVYIRRYFNFVQDEHRETM